MAKIQVLSQETINQIAAGEVVERPASVVKELIENAIDAKATAVTCEIKDGGISFIRITDNGGGIDKEEIPTAFLRHATSKIKSVEDLLTVGSLGFRGEALSSIAAVAQVELVTKTRSAFMGARYIIEGGEEQSLSDIGCPDGTTFLIRNLFFNTPARRKFLKSAMTEAGYISDLMERLAISHPEVSFKFINNNKTVLHTFGNSQLKDIIYHVYGRTVASELVKVSAEHDTFRMEGFVGKPIISRGNRNFENYFINGRYIKSNIVSKAIEEAYHGYSMQHKYPFTAIHFTVAAEFIDVNVHPTKMEIRFTNSDAIYQMTYNAIKQALTVQNMIPDVELSASKKEEKQVIKNVPEPFEASRMKPQGSASYQAPGMKPLAAPAFEPSGRSSFGNTAGRSTISSQSGVYSHSVQKTPFTRETPVFTDESKQMGELTRETELNKLREAIIHASNPMEQNHDTEDTSDSQKQSKEEEMSDDLNQNKTDALKSSEITEAGNTPNSFEQPALTDIHQESFVSEEEQKRVFSIIGQLFATYWLVECDQQLFIIDQHAAHEKILYEATMKRLKNKECLSQMISPPVILTLNLKEEAVLKENADTLKMLGFEIEPFGGKEYCVSGVPADMFGLCGESLLIDFIDDLVLDTPKGTPDIILEKIASMSCKAAVKGNHKLTAMEARALIEQLLTLDNPFHCPHGRPIIVSMTKYELEKKFKRII